MHGSSSMRTAMQLRGRHLRWASASAAVPRSVSSAKNALISADCCPLSRSRMPSNIAWARERALLFRRMVLAQRLHEVVANRRVGHFIRPVVVVHVLHQVIADAFAQHPMSL